LEGFRSTFSEKYHEPYNLLIEYLDISRLEDDKYAKRILELIPKNAKGEPLKSKVEALDLPKDYVAEIAVKQN